MEDGLSYKVIGAAIEVHKTLGGSGLLERVYESCLCQELGHQGLNFKRQVYVPLKYKGVTCSELFYIDILVENELIVEIRLLKRIIPCIKHSF